MQPQSLELAPIKRDLLMTVRKEGAEFLKAARFDHLG
jgi:hypothetical protein